MAKLSSWFLLMIVSYTLVARVNGVDLAGRVAVAGAAGPAARPDDPSRPRGRRDRPGASCCACRTGAFRSPSTITAAASCGALMLFLLAAALRPADWGSRSCLIAAFTAAAIIECGRLVHAPALDAFRLRCRASFSWARSSPRGIPAPTPSGSRRPPASRFPFIVIAGAPRCRLDRTGRPADPSRAD
ncbi:hypothetical protein ACU4GA_17710 [Methylobacterium oryzae CBMB20]